jgi:hypothetical protein
MIHKKVEDVVTVLERLVLKAAGLTLHALIAEVAKYLNVDEALIRSPGKQRAASRAWAIIAHLAVNYLKLTGAETAQALTLTPSAVSKLHGKRTHRCAVPGDRRQAGGSFIGLLKSIKCPYFTTVPQVPPKSYTPWPPKRRGVDL